MTPSTRYSAAATLILLLAGGCGPRLSEKEIGAPVFDLPKLPGSDAPYPLPQLDAAAPADKESPTPAETAGPAAAHRPVPAGALPAEPEPVPEAEK